MLSQINKKKKTEITLKNHDGALCSEPSWVAETFKLPQSKLFPTLLLGPADSKEIFQVLTNLPNKYSSGLDEVPINILKAVAEYISDPLAERISVYWTISNKTYGSYTVPIFKNGDQQSASNYLSAFSKVFEKVILQQNCAFFRCTLYTF